MKDLQHSVTADNTAAASESQERPNPKLTRANEPYVSYVSGSWSGRLGHSLTTCFEVIFSSVA